MHQQKRRQMPQVLFLDWMAIGPQVAYTSLNMDSFHTTIAANSRFNEDAALS